MWKIFVGIGLLLAFAYLVDSVSVAQLRKQPTYALQPSDCKYAGKVATGWEVYRVYKGGINNGGMTAATEYECH